MKEEGPWPLDATLPGLLHFFTFHSIAIQRTVEFSFLTICVNLNKNDDDDECSTWSYA